jgi:general secretion pathway protein M
MSEIPLALRRSLALTLLLFLTWGFYALAVDPLLKSHSRHQETIAKSVVLLERYERIAQEKSAAEAILARLKRDRRAEAGFLAAQSETLAGAELQNRAKGVIEAAGGTLSSVQGLPPKVDGKVRQVTIRVQLTGSTEALARVLYALETSMPFLFIDNLDIQARRDRRGKGGSEEAVTLDVRFDVSGYMRDNAA